MDRLEVLKLIEIATKKHAREVSRCLSEPTKLGVLGRNWTGAEKFARALINRSTEAFAVRSPDGRLLAVFGLTMAQLTVAGPWCLTTVYAREFPIVLFSLAREVLKTWRDNYPLIVFWLHAKDTRGVALAERLGLRVGTPVVQDAHRDFFREVVVKTPRLAVP